MTVIDMSSIGSSTDDAPSSIKELPAPRLRRQVAVCSFDVVIACLQSDQLSLLAGLVGQRCWRGAWLRSVMVDSECGTLDTNSH